jgi:hypothetical protein
MKSLKRHLIEQEDLRYERMKRAAVKPSTPESRKACEEFLRASQSNPMLKPSDEVREEMDRILFETLNRSK